MKNSKRIEDMNREELKAYDDELCRYIEYVFWFTGGFCYVCAVAYMVLMGLAVPH